jgi:cell wall-associated NlpC family hydrolase
VIVAAVAAPLAPAGAPADKALAFARAQLGKPYVWGGTGPRGYDCSGLTQASWRAAGLALPRTAAEQYAGVHVPVARATPGDLIFWSSSSRPSGIYHVGLYAGDHRMIDAAHPGTDVRVEAVWPGVFPVATQP